MTTIGTHLTHALAQLYDALHQLECALEHSCSQDYGIEWTSAIRRAIARNKEALRHVERLVARKPLLDEPSLLTPARKEN